MDLEMPGSFSTMLRSGKSQFHAIEVWPVLEDVSVEEVSHCTMAIRRSLRPEQLQFIPKIGKNL